MITKEKHFVDGDLHFSATYDKPLRYSVYEKNYMENLDSGIHLSGNSFRRIPPPDPAAGRYLMEALEPCLVETIDSLLLNGHPVFHIPINPDAYWDVSDMLLANFASLPVEGQPAMVQLTAPLATRSSALMTCATARTLP